MRNGLLMLVLVMGIGALLYTWLAGSTPANNVGYGDFLSRVQQGQVQKVVQKGDNLEVTASDTKTTYTVVIPSPIFTQVLNDMRTATEAGGRPFDPKIYAA